jgi:small neutral amino acid transporter SnatA (MarC family)
LTQAARLSEPFWFCLSFLLFLVMGPFSVIAVVYGLWSLASEENRQKMIEPASC